MRQGRAKSACSIWRLLLPISSDWPPSKRRVCRASARASERSRGLSTMGATSAPATAAKKLDCSARRALMMLRRLTAAATCVAIASSAGRIAAALPGSPCADTTCRVQTIQRTWIVGAHADHHQGGSLDREVSDHHAPGRVARQGPNDERTGRKVMGVGNQKVVAVHDGALDMATDGRQPRRESRTVATIANRSFDRREVLGNARQRFGCRLDEARAFAEHVEDAAERRWRGKIEGRLGQMHTRVRKDGRKPVDRNACRLARRP